MKHAKLKLANVSSISNKAIFSPSVLFSEGDPVQFEAVPQEGNADDPASSYCSWFATLVWKGKRPPVEPYAFDSPYTTVTAATSGSVSQVIIHILYPIVD